MAEGDVLQIVVFSIFFAIALGMIGEKGRPVVEWCEAVAETMFKVTNIVMHYAPIGVGAAIAYTVGHGGLGVLWNLAWLVATLYLALIALILLVFLPIAIAFRVPIRKFAKAVKEPAVIAFSTTSSAALPRAMEVLERLGVPRRIVSFVLPLGLQLQPRRLHAVSLTGSRVRGAGRRRSAHRRSAGHDAAHADADLQGRGRRAARRSSFLRARSPATACRSKASR